MRLNWNWLSHGLTTPQSILLRADHVIDPFGSAVMSAAEGAARSLELQLEPLAMRRPEDLSDVFATAKKQGVEAVMVLGTPILFPHQRWIAELATPARLPTISPWRQLPEAGGLFSYGANLREMFRRLAEVVDRILKGAKPRDIPVERPTKSELVIDLKTAKALGLTIPCELHRLFSPTPWTRASRRGSSATSRPASGSSPLESWG